MKKIRILSLVVLMILTIFSLSLVLAGGDCDYLVGKGKAIGKICPDGTNILECDESTDMRCLIHIK